MSRSNKNGMFLMLALSLILSQQVFADDGERGSVSAVGKALGEAAGAMVVHSKKIGSTSILNKVEPGLLQKQNTLNEYANAARNYNLEAEHYNTAVTMFNERPSQAQWDHYNKLRSNEKYYRDLAKEQRKVVDASRKEALEKLKLPENAALRSKVIGIAVFNKVVRPVTEIALVGDAAHRMYRALFGDEDQGAVGERPAQAQAQSSAVAKTALREVNRTPASVSGDTSSSVNLAQ